MQKVNNLEAFKKSFDIDWMVRGYKASKKLFRPHYVPQIFMVCEILFEPVPREEGDDALYYHIEWYYSNGGLKGNIRNSFLAMSLKKCTRSSVTLMQSKAARSPTCSAGLISCPLLIEVKQ